MNPSFPIATSAIISLLALSACDTKRQPAPVVEAKPSVQAPKPAATPPPTPAPDNTAKNKADAPGAPTDTKTPLDQSESAEHIKITADIRKAVLSVEGMSTNGKNCKIITDAAGIVTLRGVVDSQAEKNTIEGKARAIAGVTKVDNQLEVKAG
ncbi:MAG: BON domain-containing protein [Phycisphaerales bacterium]